MATLNAKIKPRTSSKPPKAASKAPAKPRGKPKPLGPLGERSGVTPAVRALLIDLDRIIPDPDQPRREFDEEALDRLAESLANRGQLQPILVRWSPEADRYIVITGERRFRAALKAGLPTLRCWVDDNPRKGIQVYIDQLVENVNREDLSDLDKARSFRKVIDETGWSQSTLAKELGTTQGTVSKALALLEMPEVIRSRVESGELAPSVARALAKAGPEADIDGLVEAAVLEEWTEEAARETVAEVNRSWRPDPSLAKPSLSLDPQEPVAKALTWRDQLIASHPDLGFVEVEACHAIDCETFGQFDAYQSIMGFPKGEAFKKVWPALMGLKEGRTEPGPIAEPVKHSKVEPDDWASLPIEHLDLGKKMLDKLRAAKIRDCGSAWAMLSNDGFRAEYSWSSIEHMQVEEALLKLRHAHHDLPQHVAPIANGKPSLPTAEPPKPEMNGMGLEWSEAGYQGYHTLPISTLGAVEIVARSPLGRQTKASVIAALEDALQVLKGF